METPVVELVREFVEQARVPPENEEEDLFLQGLIDDFHSSPAMFKRDIRRRLEKDPDIFLRSACRILKAKSVGPGAAYVMEQLWSNPVMVASLVDPAILPLPAAITFAKRWQPYDPLIDIKLLHKGFPADDGVVHDIDIIRAKRALAIVNELPANRHILLPLVNLLCSSDARVRSKAAAIYGRTCQNPEWVHKRLAEADPRVRANVIESLWGVDSDAIRAVLKEATRDRNHRVAVNAMIGLHLSGAADATASLQKLACGKEPMGRAAAAFAMGQILKDEFKPVLETLLRDANANVRGRALAALIRLRRKQEAAKNEASAPAPREDAAEPEETPAETPEPPPAPDLQGN